MRRIIMRVAFCFNRDVCRVAAARTASRSRSPLSRAKVASLLHLNASRPLFASRAFFASFIRPPPSLFHELRYNELNFLVALFAALWDPAPFRGTSHWFAGAKNELIWSSRVRLGSESPFITLAASVRLPAHRHDPATLRTRHRIERYLLHISRCNCTNEAAS